MSIITRDVPTPTPDLWRSDAYPGPLEMNEKYLYKMMIMKENKI
jgi:hypothetical protein